MGIIRIELEDLLTLQKVHPCGSKQWRVVRVGLDIGIRCTGCGRFIMVSRRELERRIREIQRGEIRLKPLESQIEVAGR